MAGKHCTICGYPNSERRGACLMCYGYLGEPASANVVCPNSNCGLGNDRNASFCLYCGTALVEEVSAVPGALALAITVLDEASGVTGGDRIGPGTAEPAEEPEMDEEQAAAFEEFKAQQTALGDQAEVEFEEEEEYVPPSALTLEQEALGVSEPSEEEELMPPPPPEEEPAMAMGDLSLEPSEPVETPPSVADSLPPVPDELSEDDLAPPVPQGLPDFDDDLAAPSRAAQESAAEAVDLEEELLPPPPPDEEQATASKAEAEDSEEEGLGGWSLDFADADEDDEEEEK